MNEKLKMNNTVSIYKEDSYRYIVFLIFSAYCFFIGLLLNPYAPIADQLKLAYQISLPQVLTTMIFFVVGKIIGAPMAGLLLEKVGIKEGIYVSLLLMGLGCFLRTMMQDALLFVLVGQFLLGVAASIVISAQMKFLYEWFHPKRRGFFCTMISLTFNIGAGTGLVFILLFVKNKESNIVTIKEELQNFDNFNLIVVVLFTIVHTFLFLSKPRLGNGYIKMAHDLIREGDEVVFERQADNSTSIGVWRQVEVLFAQKAFRRNLIVYVGFGSINMLLSGSVIIVFGEFGITGWKMPITVIFVFIFGIIGAFRFIQVYLPLENGKDYFFNFVLTAMGIFCVSAVLLILEAPFVFILLAYSIYGFSFFLGIPVSLEYMTREVKDCPLTFVNGFIFFSGQIWGCVVLMINETIFSVWKDDKKFAIYFLLGLNVILYLPIVLAMKLM